MILDMHELFVFCFGKNNQRHFLYIFSVIDRQYYKNTNLKVLKWPFSLTVHLQMYNKQSNLSDTAVTKREK